MLDAAAASPRNLRLKGAIICEGSLRLFRLATDHFDSDLEGFVVYLAIISANVRRFTRGDERLRYADDQIPPEDERAPVSRRAIAASVGLPRETVRRKVAELVDRGHVIQVRGGVRATAPALERNLPFVLGAIRTFEKVAVELGQSDSI